MKSVKSEKLRTLEINKKLFFLGLARKHCLNFAVDDANKKKRSRAHCREKNLDIDLHN